jgi:hypothetical protein
MMFEGHISLNEILKETFHYITESCKNLLIRPSVRNQRRRFFVQFRLILLDQI